MSFDNTIKLDGLKAQGRAGANRGLFLGAEHVRQEAQTLNPIEEGTLERTAATSVDEGALMSAVSYDTEYAVAQHERLDYDHKGQGQAKYLETAFNTERVVVSNLIAREIRRTLGT